METKIGEVIESTTNAYTAECYELYDIPAFGSLVKTVDGTLEIYGVVAQAGTSGIEPGRRPVARGKDEPTEAAVYQSSPQLLKLLRSEFTVLVIGHGTIGKIFQYLPPKPARIHAFVHVCAESEVKQFSRSFDFLNHLVNPGQQVAAEELVAATLREMSKVQDNPHDFLVAAGKALTSLLGEDYQKLRAILGRIKT